MAEYTESSMMIEAPAADVMDVITDYEAYPEWNEVELVDVVRRGEGGRGMEVAYEVKIPVLGKASYTLAYQYAPGDDGLSWTTKEARGAVRDIRGEYLLTEVEDRTKVTYRLAVELAVLVPGFIRNEGAERIIENALKRLKDRVESRT
ncbi:MAG TPA: SRPBCC family protein [Actinomycetota bacterium]|nr:SRPBCC family protein [Actinomycetota bacterium]